MNVNENATSIIAHKTVQIACCSKSMHVRPEAYALDRSFNLQQPALEHAWNLGEDGPLARIFDSTAMHRGLQTRFDLPK